MKKLLLILLCLPMIGFGQKPNGTNVTMKEYTINNIQLEGEFKNTMNDWFLEYFSKNWKSPTTETTSSNKFIGTYFQIAKLNCFRYKLELTQEKNDINVMVSIIEICASNCSKPKIPSSKPYKYLFFHKGKKKGQQRSPKLINKHMEKVDEMLSSLENYLIQ